MDKPYVIGNWKMNLSLLESVTLARAIVKSKPSHEARVVLCPSFTSLVAVAENVRGASIDIGAQDVAAKENGAYTGEVSAAMLKDVGCQYVIIGHSERRQYLGEGGELIKNKLIVACKYGLTPVLCVGERQEDRQAGKWESVLSLQLEEAMVGLRLNGNSLIVAYEPVWAIGSGQTVSSNDARLVANMIRDLLSKLLGSTVSQKQCAILYGGSVTADNVHMFVGQDLMDGVLVGTSSLRSEEFFAIINAVIK